MFGIQFLVNNNETTNGLDFYIDYYDSVGYSDLDVITTANSITMNAWQYVAVTWDGSNTAANDYETGDTNEVRVIVEYPLSIL